MIMNSDLRQQVVMLRLLTALEKTIQQRFAPVKRTETDYYHVCQSKSTQI